MRKARRIGPEKIFLHVSYGHTKIVLVRKNIYHKLNTSSKFKVRHLETKHTHKNIWPQHSANAWETVLLRSRKTQLRLMFGSHCLVSGRALARLRFSLHSLLLAGNVLPQPQIFLIENPFLWKCSQLAGPTAEEAVNL